MLQPMLVCVVLPRTVRVLRVEGVAKSRGDPDTRVSVCLAADPLANEYQLVVYDGAVRYY